MSDSFEYFIRPSLLVPDIYVNYYWLGTIETNANWFEEN